MDNRLTLIPKLGEIAAKLTSSKDIKSLLGSLDSIVEDIVKCDYKAYYIMNDRRNRLNLVHTKNTSSKLKLMAQSIAERSLAFWVWENNDVVSLPFNSGCKKIPDINLPQDAKVRSKVYLPIKGRKDKVIGVLALASNKVDYFSEEAISLLKFIGNLVGEVYSNILLTMAQKRTERNLQRALKEANSAKKAKEVFLAKMSHEIRTPMNAIIGMGGLMERTVLNDQQKKYVDAISSSSNHLLALINDVLDISKIEAEGFVLEQRSFDIEEEIQRIMLSFNFLASKKGLELNLKLDPQIPKVVIGDSLRLGQVLINLLNNAIKFTDTGSVTLSSKVLKKSNKSKSKRIQFKVSDTGIGIDKSCQEKIFKRFKQADDSTTRQYGGTGLGLPIAKEIVSKYKGEIWVESEKGKGSDFIVEIDFPVGKESTLKKSFVKRISYDFSKLHVLLVEDNKINSQLATVILKENKAKVDHAFSGVEAVDKVKSGRYDLILMDINMPLMNGYEATAILRNQLKIDAPIIALTANVEEEVKNKCLEVGMDDYLFKPFKYNELLAKVAEYTLGLDAQKEAV
jgi:signal transduction histidine kinase/CheY-like chemotaxis protein